jgi:hypothetical protein
MPLGSAQTIVGAVSFCSSDNPGVSTTLCFAIDAQLRTSLLSLSAQIFDVINYGCMKINVQK